MASSVARGHATLRVQAIVSRMQRDRAWNAVTRRSARVVRGSDGAGSRRTAFGDGVLAVCVLALVGVAVLGGLLILFAWVTATLPMNQIIACPEFDGCVVPTPDQDQAVGVGDPRIDEPVLTP